MAEETKMVEIFVDKRDTGGEQNLFIGFNGKNYLIPTGVRTQVPDFIADELERSRSAQRIADSTSDKLVEQFRQSQMQFAFGR